MAAPSPSTAVMLRRVAEVVAELERAPPVPVVLPSVVAQVGLGRQQSPMAVMVFNRAAAAVP